MTDMIERLEAGEGSRKLDAAIALFEIEHITAEEKASRGRSAAEAIAAGEPYTGIPHYTTSIDAKIPGENIVYMSFTEQGDFAPRGSYYTVFHEDPHGDRHHGEHKSEAIARRIAALKARGHD